VIFRPYSSGDVLRTKGTILSTQYSNIDSAEMEESKWRTSKE
jgi:hypothetical protein